MTAAYHDKTSGPPLGQERRAQPMNGASTMGNPTQPLTVRFSPDTWQRIQALCAVRSEDPYAWVQDAINAKLDEQMAAVVTR